MAYEDIYGPRDPYGDPYGPGGPGPSAGTLFTPGPGFTNTSPLANPSSPNTDPSGYHQVGVTPAGAPIWADATGAQFIQSQGQYWPYTAAGGATGINGGGTGTGTPAPTGGAPAGPPGGFDFTQRFNEPFSPPAQTPMPGVPEYRGPGYTQPPAFSFADFSPTTAGDMTSDPGYGFRVGQGRDVLEHGAAARGVLNTGMTLKDILDYGQNAASQEFQNVDARRRTDYTMKRGNALDIYNTNYGTQYRDPYSIARQSALDTFAPQMTGYTTNAAATQRANEFNTNTAFNRWNQDYNIFRNTGNDLWSRYFQTATA